MSARICSNCLVAWSAVYLFSKTSRLFVDANVNKCQYAARTGSEVQRQCRAAYESRAARVAIVRERNAKKERRREIRALGSAERALLLAEQGVPLVPRVNVKKTR